MKRKIFRKYDIRGVAEEDLTPSVVIKIGRAFGSRLARGNGKIATVGRDVRLSSNRIYENLVEGILSTGVDVIDIGVVPTPLLMFSQYHFDVSGGVMITASHNPSEYNGFKIVHDRKSLWGDDLTALADEAEAGAFHKGDGSVTCRNIIPAYCEMIMEKVQLSRHVRLALDLGNGSGCVVAPNLFKEMGCLLSIINGNPDGRFPGHPPDPTVEKNLEGLRATVIENKADIGVGYDGDADRIGVIDDSGEFLYGDQILTILARDVLRKQKGAKIIFDVKCSDFLKNDIRQNGGIPIISPSGHSIMKQRLFEENAALAGEMSGHIFYRDDYYGYDDAIYSTARLLKILERSEKPLSRLLDNLPETYSTPEMRCACPDNKKFMVVESLKDYFRYRYQTNEIDGVRVKFDKGWGLIRPSNTEPAITVRLEAESEQHLDDYRQLVMKRLYMELR